MVDCWQEGVTHVVLDEQGVMGPAALLALLLGLPIVTPAWWV